MNNNIGNSFQELDLLNVASLLIQLEEIQQSRIQSNFIYKNIQTIENKLEKINNKLNWMSDIFIQKFADEEDKKKWNLLKNNKKV